MVAATFRLPRTVAAETLDALAPDDPRAMRSRRDLRRVHRVIQSPRSCRFSGAPRAVFIGFIPRRFPVVAVRHRPVYQIDNSPP